MAKVSKKKTLRISSNKGQTGDMVLRKFGTAETCWLALLELDTSIENILMALQKTLEVGWLYDPLFRPRNHACVVQGT